MASYQAVRSRPPRRAGHRCERAARGSLIARLVRITFGSPGAHLASRLRRYRGAPRGFRSDDDDEFSCRVVRFHGGVRLTDLIEAVHAVDGYGGFAGGDGVEELLQHP